MLGMGNRKFSKKPKSIGKTTKKREIFKEIGCERHGFGWKPKKLEVYGMVLKKDVRNTQRRCLSVG